MSFEQCTRCHEYSFSPGNCRCKSFTAWLKEGGSENDGYGIFAMDKEAAAEKFCSQYDADAGEYHIVESGHEEVMVRDNQTQEIFEFDVDAHSKPVYNAIAK